MRIINFYKKIGETPLEAIGRLKEEKPELVDERLTYAGRLDPMAEGLLLILVDATEKEKKEILNLPKKYYFEVLWGFESDTYDILGKSKFVDERLPEDFEIQNAIKKIKKIKKMSYPPFSSKTVLGKPLFTWAREGRLEEIKIPEREVKISILNKSNDYKISSEELLKIFIQRIKLVKGDFRQKEVIDLWKQNIEKNKTFLISCFETEVSSGTYVRNIGDYLGKELGIGVICFRIVRTQIGDQKIENSSLLYKHQGLL